MRALVWLIAVVALGAVAFFTIQRYPVLIETDLKQRASQALESAKLSFAKVTVAGRVVTLSGEAPGATAKEDAVKVAGDVWGVQQVNDALVIPAAATLPVAPQAVIGSAAQAPNREVPAPPSPQPLEVPPPAGEPATALPTVEALVDPSLAPPIDADSSEPASPSPPTETAIPPAQTAPAAPAPAAPAAAPVTSPAVPAQPQPAAPAPEAPAIAQGVAAGLTASVQQTSPVPPTAPAPTPAVAEAPVYRLEAHLQGRQIELQGMVSTPSAQRALVAHIRRHVRRAQVVDSLQVAHSKPDSDWLGVARTGLSQLAHLDTGSLRLEGRRIEISGRPRSEGDRARVLAALNELPHGYTSTVLLERKQDMPVPAASPPATPSPAPVRAAPQAAAPKATASRRVAARYRAEPPRVKAEGFAAGECRRRFGDLLPRMAVVFRSGSSRVQSNADEALDEFATVARRCPRMHIRLTGHSDTYEVPASSTSLSRERALAVRQALADRGVAPAIVSVTGRGGMRPIFSNETADGRENNRRVEFAVW